MAALHKVGCVTVTKTVEMVLMKIDQNVSKDC